MQLVFSSTSFLLFLYIYDICSELEHKGITDERRYLWPKVFKVNSKINNFALLELLLVDDAAVGAHTQMRSGQK